MDKRVLLLCALISIGLPSRADAYLDMGTGSIIIQAIAAVLVGGAVFWKNILSFFKRNKDNSSNDPSDDD